MKAVSDLAKELGITQAALRRVAVRLGLIAEGDKPQYFTPDQTKTIEKCRPRTFGHWAEQLGVERADFKTMAKPGTSLKAESVTGALSEEDLRELVRNPYKPARDLAGELTDPNLPYNVLTELIYEMRLRHVETGKLISAGDHQLSYEQVRDVRNSKDALAELEVDRPRELFAAARRLGIAVPAGLLDDDQRTRLIVEYRGWAETPGGDPNKPPTVAVFGAGIAGLTAAHELADRGFDVTVYERELDERQDQRLGGPMRNLTVPRPPVMLGGLAASQYATRDGSRHRPFINRNGVVSSSITRRSGEDFPGEHGFRFFPAYYMHLWDMMQRIPIYEARVVPIGLPEMERIAGVLDSERVEELIESRAQALVDLYRFEDLFNQIERDDEQVAEDDSLRERIGAFLFAEGRERRNGRAKRLRALADDILTGEAHEIVQNWIREARPSHEDDAGPRNDDGAGEVEGPEVANADIRWVPTHRTVFDNVSRIITQASTTTDGRPTVIFPREAPRTFAEMIGAVSQFRDLGFSPQDLKTFTTRLARYLVTSPLRRSLELENVSAYDFFTGRDEKTGHLAYQYTATFDRYLKDLPKVLAAFDCEWGDARTNIDTLLQLQLMIDRRDNKADGVLNGPTTTAWFDHWFQHLSRMQVDFVPARLEMLDMVQVGDEEPELAVHVADPDGSHTRPVSADYVVVATDAFTAERATERLRTRGVAGTVLELEGFTSTHPPDEPPRKEVGPVSETHLGHLRSLSLEELREESREAFGAVDWSKTRFELIEDLRSTRYGRRTGFGLRQMGRRKWDRFQTLAGIQYFFDTEFQLARGHVYYSGSDWALSSINQAGLWEDRPILAEDGFVSILSVDIGDWNTPSTHRDLVDDDHPHGRAAWECTVDEIAREVWRQIGSALSNDRERQGVQSFPEPVSYSIDRYLELEEPPEHPPSDWSPRVVANHAPYLVPIVGDWTNRPGGYPWDPHGTSVAYVREEPEREIHKQRHVWMADHGGYEVHCDSLVFAGTWTKTFTRMTTMEAACESGRHAVNAILDHWIQVRMGERGQKDTRRPETVGLDWRWPFGFVDQEGSLPVRQPTPAGDYCFIFDIENREPADFRPTRVVDERYADRGLPHPWDAQGTDSIIAAMNQGAIPLDPTMPTDPFSPAYLRWLLQHLKNWRIMFEALDKITDPSTGQDIDLKDPLGAKSVHTAPPGWEAISPSTEGRQFRLDDEPKKTDKTES